MPELPEVQTIVSDLRKKILGGKITGFWTNTPKIIKGVALNKFRKEILGFLILDIRRRGKNILFYLGKIQKGKRKIEKVILAHQKMTGHFLIGKWKVVGKGKSQKIIPLIKGPIAEDPFNQYIRVIFNLSGGWQLGLSDLRKFAKLTVGSVEEIENSKEMRSLGPEALSSEFSWRYLYPLLLKKKKSIKSVLLDQEIVAGVGNIYADEALFLAKIHPQKRASTLKIDQVKKMVQAIKKVLRKSIALRGTSIIDYRDALGRRGGYDKVRLVYGKEGLPCPSCSTPIKRIKIGQRSAHFCPRCQKQ
ncbi:MAG: DNA-formamidopyrimidine glycosylase [Patescibacteria group bacterium]|nr:DNA-formamidopyrimidine glycosylase [Patescibacteria group bacterium]